jgi:hypothetical protein
MKKRPYDGFSKNTADLAGQIRRYRQARCGGKSLVVDGADEITMSAPFLRALVALSASKSTRPKGADMVISSAQPQRYAPSLRVG